MIGQLYPRVPDRTDQFARDAVARRRTEEYSQISALAERCTAVFFLPQRTLVKCKSDFLGSGGEKLIQHACIEGAGCYRIDVNVVWSRFFGERLYETNHGCLGCRVGA